MFRHGRTYNYTGPREEDGMGRREMVWGGGRWYGEEGDGMGMREVVWGRWMGESKVGGKIKLCE